MKHTHRLAASICLLFSITACNRHEEASDPTAEANTEEQTAAPEQTSESASFSPEEIRDYCGYVARNAQYFVNLKVQLISTPKTETLDEMISMLDDAYQFNTSLDLTDEERQMLSKSLWVTKAFVENSEVLSRYIAKGLSLGPGFAAANEQWCQRSMRGNQPPFQFAGGVVPYVEFKRN